jgi:hypothetical protein
VLWWGRLKERGYFEDGRLVGRIILIWPSKSRMEVVNFIDMAQDRNKW